MKNTLTKHRPLGAEYLLLRWGGKRNYSWLIHSRLAFTCLALFAACLTLAIYSINIGTIKYSLEQVIQALIGTGDEQTLRVIQQYRLPRIIIGFFAGASLGASGAIFQSLSRNPLGSPDIVGFTQGAVAGAIIQIVVFNAGSFAVAFTSFLSGIATAFLVYFLSRTGHNINGSNRLILVGIGIGATLSSLNGLILTHGNLDLSIEANLWRTGSLEGRGWSQVWPLMLCALICIPLLARIATQLTLLESGEELAAQLGVHTERVRLNAVIIAVALVSGATASCGPIAFVALAAPQLLRRIANYPKVSIYGAGLTGATLLMTADTLTRSLPLTLTLPVGRVTGLVGGIYMIWLIGIKRETR